MCQEHLFLGTFLIWNLRCFCFLAIWDSGCFWLSSWPCVLYVPALESINHFNQWCFTTYSIYSLDCRRLCTKRENTVILFFFSLHINYCHEMKSIGNRYCKLSPTNNNESLTELKDSWFIIGGWLKQEIWAVEPGGFGGSVSSYIILPSMHDLKACHCSRREKCPIPTVYRALLKHVSMPALVKRESF